VPAAVEVRYRVNLGVPERFAVVLLVPGDDVPVEPAVVPLGLSALVLDRGADGRELDGPSHQFAGNAAEAAEQVENHAAVVFLRVVDARPFLVVAVLDVAVVDVGLAEVGVGLAGVASRRAVLLYDGFHPVAKPAGKRVGGDDAADLVLRVVVFVVATRCVVPVGHDRVAYDEQVALDPNVHIRDVGDVGHSVSMS